MGFIKTRLQRVGMSSTSANFLLLLTAMAWGFSYVLLKVVGDTIHPFELVAIRFSISAIICSFLFRSSFSHFNKRALLYGILLGIVMFGCSNAIIFGVMTTDASTASFLVSSGIVFVPILQAIRKRRLPEKTIVIGTTGAITGIALLSLEGSLNLSGGAAFCILGAVLYATHILITDETVHKEHAMLLGLIQQICLAIFGWIATFTFTTPTMPPTAAVWAAVLGLTIICSALPFAAQPIAQRYTNPEHAAIILALEPVFGTLFAFLFLAERFSLQAGCGALLVLASVLFSTVMQSRHKEK